MTEIPLEAFIFMKVGNHAGEDFGSIITRKKRERVKAGQIFWGFGGTACHPIMQAQPFARLYVKKQGRIYLLMEAVDSRADPDVDPAVEYSDDGANWHRIPAGISVIGSKYAFVLDDIQSGNIEVDFANYVVGIGPSRGRTAVDYMQGRVDKACLTLSSRQSSIPLPFKKPIGFAAKLVPPYAVMLR